MDEIVLKRLAEIANINIDDFASELFKAGTSLEGKTPKDLFYQDFKIFNIGDLKVGVSQTTTTYMDGLLPFVDGLKELTPPGRSAY